MVGNSLRSLETACPTSVNNITTHILGGVKGLQLREGTQNTKGSAAVQTAL